MKQIHVFFSGNVQGIGFRYSALEIAQNLGLSGFVKNLPDGRVELLAEGSEEKLQELCQKLNQEFKNQIQDSEISWSETSQKYSSFEINF